jgi:hypothetical protein
MSADYLNEKTLYELFCIVNKRVNEYNPILKEEHLKKHCASYRSWDCSVACLCKHSKAQAILPQNKQKDFFVKKILMIINYKYLFLDFYQKKMSEIMSAPYTENSDANIKVFFDASQQTCLCNSTLFNHCIKYLENPQEGFSLINQFLTNNENYRLLDVI